MAAPKTLEGQVRRAFTRAMSEHPGFAMMPLSRRRFRRLMAKADPPTAAIVEVVLDDYALLLRVLQVVNSAAYSSGVEVNQAARAVVMLGRSPLVELVRELPEPPKGEDPRAEQRALGALLSALYAEQLGRRLDPKLKERAYIAGMFQPIGLHALDLFLPELSEQLFERARARARPFEKFAPAVLGSELPVFSEWVGRQLRIPKSVLLGVQPSRRLKNPARPSPEELIAAVASMAGALSARRVYPELPERIPAEVLLEHFYEAFGDLHLDVSDLDRVVDGVLSDKEAPLGLARSGEALVASLQERARPAEPSEEVSPAGPVSTVTRAASGVTQGIFEQMEGMRARLGADLVRRVVFLLRVRGEEVLSFRVGLGERLDGAERWFRVPLGESSVFTEALARPQLTSCSARPQRFPRALLAHAPRRGELALSPVFVQGQAIGLFYLEGEGSAGQLRDAARELLWLKQAVEAQLNGAVSA